jgi:hypothetical protein
MVTMKFGLHVSLLVRAVGPVQERPMLDLLEEVYASLVDQEPREPALLDSDMNVTAENDTRALCDIRLTVETADAGEALSVGMSCLRTAIHSVGIHTPHWESVSHDEVVDVYTLEATAQQVEARPLAVA